MLPKTAAQARASVRRHGMHAKMCGSNCDHADCGRLVGHTQNAVPDVLSCFVKRIFLEKEYFGTFFRERFL